MKESYIEKRFVQLCRRNGMHVIKMSSQYEMGIPDRLVILDGFAGFAEIKAFGQKPRQIQLGYMRKLRNRGCFVAVVNHPNDIVTWIMKFRKHVESIRNAPKRSAT